MKSNNLDALPPRVTKDIVDYLVENNLDIRNELAAREYMRNQMSEGELMNAYLVWNGIVGFTEQIICTWQAIQQAAKGN